MKAKNKLAAAAALLVFGMVGGGCPGDDGGGDGSDGPSTLGDTGTDDGTSMSTSTTATSTSTSTSTTDTASDSSTGPVEPQPNGSECSDNAECESDMCFVVSVLGGICGECLTDADCPDGGCSIPNPLSDPPQGAECNMGEPGEGCMSDEVCMDDQVCAEILNVPGVLEASTCSECLTDADCEGDLLCSPSYDILNLSGQRTCVMAGMVPNGEGCDLEGSGTEACMSGICYAADIMGLLTLGVCGECGVDADCGMDEVCAEPDIDLEAGEVIPPMCGAP